MLNGLADNVESNAESMMEFFTKDYKIFIDTCSLMEEKDNRIEKFLSNIIPYLEQYDNKIIVPSRVIDELKKKSNQPKTAEIAKRGLERLSRIRYLISIRGEETDNFTDNVFAVIFTQFRLKYKLLLITQDRDLSQDIFGLNQLKSQQGNRVFVKKINKYGYLSNLIHKNVNQNNNEDMSLNAELNVVGTHSEVTFIDKFALRKEAIRITTGLISISEVPGENGVAYFEDKQEIAIGNCLAQGGEGAVFETNTPYVAKLYFKDKITTEKSEKLKLMMTKKVKCEGICWPEAALYNKQEQLIGYLMQRAQGKELQTSVFQPMWIKKHLANWKKKDLAELSLTILQKIQFLHERNIVLGDINPRNILFVSPKEVYFVDADSYQVEGFACPVGTIPFKPQEIFIKEKKYKDETGKDLNCIDYLRTFDNEYFSIAVLLFMILLPGKHPYSLQGGESIASNIMNMDFAYPLGDKSNKKTPDGPWRYMWSHLTYDLKHAFYHTFHKEGELNCPGKRQDVSSWIHLISYYYKLLDSEKLASQDEMSLDLFPSRNKKMKNKNYVECKICKREEIEEKLQNGICRACLNEGEEYACKRCGAELFFSNYDKYIKGKTKYELCKKCLDYKNEIYRVIQCVDCGRQIEITQGEREYYEEKGFSLPKRCKACKQKKQEWHVNNGTVNKHSNGLLGFWNRV